MMDIRTTPNPLIRAAGRALGVLNARHPWNHNDHFHAWVVGALPGPTTRVLDVGCGRGELLAVLAGLAGEVDGIDADQEMAYLAASRFQDVPHVRVRRRTLAEHSARPELAGAYDAITMIASLHHMPLDAALAEARQLLRPGGRLLVVTLTTPVSAADQAWDVAGALSNPVIGLFKHPRPVREPGPERPQPVQDPAWSIGTLREQAAAQLPGAVIRRREGFRVTLRWQKPGRER